MCIILANGNLNRRLHAKEDEEMKKNTTEEKVKQTVEKMRQQQDNIVTDTIRQLRKEQEIFTSNGKRLHNQRLSSERDSNSFNQTSTNNDQNSDGEMEHEPELSLDHRYSFATPPRKGS